MNNMIFFNEQGHLNDEGTALFVDALHLNKTGNLPEEIQTHVDSCEICKKTILDLVMLTDGAYAISEKDHPYFGKIRSTDSDKKGNTFFYLKIAAMIIVIAALFFLINKNVQKPKDIRIVQNDENTEPSGSNEKTAPVDDDEDQEAVLPAKDESQILSNRKLYASNYQKSSVLEEMINTRTRSSSVNILTPLNHQRYQTNEKIVFKWTLPKKQIPFTLIILNNREDTVKIAEGLRETYALKEKLTPGLYYWKLETEDDLFYLGKFLIE
jgi:hypothetical protein